MSDDAASRRTWHRVCLLATLGLQTPSALAAQLHPAAGQQVAITRGPSADRSDELQALVHQLARQLRLSYRHDRPRYNDRYATLAAAIELWNHSARTDAEFDELQLWLRLAIRRSLPGSSAPLPALPSLPAPRGRPAPLPPPAATITATPPALQNPFQDDAPLTGEREETLSGSPLQVNLGELAARVQGYNLGLLRVEEFLTRQTRIPPARLNQLAEELHQLLDQGEFVTLWASALEDRKRRLLPEIRPPQPVVKMLAQHIMAERKRQSSLIESGQANNDLAGISLLQDAARMVTNLGFHEWGS